MSYEVIARTDELTTAQWLSLRNTGIGGSDAAAVMGVSRYKSAYTLWAEKSLLVFPDEQSPSMAAEYGTWLELPIAQKFAKDNNVALVSWPVMVRNIERPYQIANLDFLLVHTSAEFPAGVVTRWDGDQLPEGVIAIVEVKTTGIVTYGFAEEWAHDSVPTAYDFQGMHYSDTLDVMDVVYLAFIGRQGIEMRERRYSVEQRMALRQREQIFWAGVENELAPEIDGSDSSFETLHELYPKSIDKLVEADDFLVDTFSEWTAAKAQAKELDDKIKKLRASLELAIKDGQAMMHAGKVLYTFTNNRAFDAATFIEDHKDDLSSYLDFVPARVKAADAKLYEQYLSPGAGARVLRAKGE